MKTLFKGLLKFFRFILFTVLNMFWWVIKFAFRAGRPDTYNPDRAGLPGYDNIGRRL